MAIIFTIVVSAGCSAGTLFYVAFYANNFTLFQKIASVLISLILRAAAISIVSVGWAVHPRNQFMQP